MTPTKEQTISERCGPVSHAEAYQILSRFVHSHFDRGGEKARIRIPADPQNDDDLRMHAYIDQCKFYSADSADRFAAVMKQRTEAEKEREALHDECDKWYEQSAEWSEKITRLTKERDEARTELAVAHVTIEWLKVRVEEAETARYKNLNGWHEANSNAYDILRLLDNSRDRVKTLEETARRCNDKSSEVIRGVDLGWMGTTHIIANIKAINAELTAALSSAPSPSATSEKDSTYRCKGCGNYLTAGTTTCHKCGSCGPRSGGMPPCVKVEPHQPLSMPANRTEMIREAVEADDGVISAGSPSAFPALEIITSFRRRLAINVAAVVAEIPDRYSPEDQPEMMLVTKSELVEIVNRELESLCRIMEIPSSSPVVQLPERPKIVCLCGSSRFYEAFQKANYDETMAGRIVLSIGFYPHSKTTSGQHGEGVGCDSAEKIALDELHKRKIDIADEVLVLNVGGYIGKSTASEISHAKMTGKPIRYLESHPEYEALTALLTPPKCAICGVLVDQVGGSLCYKHRPVDGQAKVDRQGEHDGKDGAM